MSDPLFWLNVLTRWLHVASAVTVVGGLLVMRAAVLPALARLPSGADAYEAVRTPLKRVLHSALGLLLLTGGWNYYQAILKIHALKEQDPTAMAAYNPVMGIKILLSLGLFGLATVLLKPAPDSLDKREGLFTASTVLGLLIILLAAFLRRLW